jgi:hypothetical protein
LLLGVASPFCRHQHTFPKGRQYLGPHFPFNERSRTAQGETPLLPDVVDPHNIRRQHFLMLRWVLLCDYCSFYHQLPKTSELGRATTAHITVVVYFRDHYHWFRVCSFAELSSAFIIPPPRALQSSTSTIQTFSLQSYITRAWGMPASFVHTCILFHTLWKVGSTGSFLLQRIALYGLTLALPYNTILSKRNIDEFRLYVLLLTSSIRGHLLSLKFRPHRATRTPHRQHRKTVIHGTRINSTAQQKGQNYTKMAKKLKSALHPLRTRARAQHLRTLERICAAVGCKTRAPAKRRIYGTGRPPNH